MKRLYIFFEISTSRRGCKRCYHRRGIALALDFANADISPSNNREMIVDIMRGNWETEFRNVSLPYSDSQHPLLCSGSWLVVELVKRSLTYFATAQSYLSVRLWLPIRIIYPSADKFRPFIRSHDIEFAGGADLTSNLYPCFCLRLFGNVGDCYEPATTRSRKNIWVTWTHYTKHPGLPLVCIHTGCWGILPDRQLAML